MQDVKPWYQSKTIWGGIVAVVAVFAGAIGFDVDDGARAQIVDSVLQLIAAAGALIAVFGRIVASELIE